MNEYIVSILDDDNDIIQASVIVAGSHEQLYNALKPLFLEEGQFDFEIEEVKSKMSLEGYVEYLKNTVFID